MKLPDWKVSKAYPAPSEVTLRALAWEFLRRNEAYQSDWHSYLEKCEVMATGDGDIAVYLHALSVNTPEAWEKFNALPDANSVVIRLYDTPAHWVQVEGVTQPHWTAVPTSKDHNAAPTLVQSSGAVRYPLDAYMGRKWGLACIANPDQAFTSGRHDFLEVATVLEVTSHGLTCLENEAGTQSDLCFHPGQWRAIAVNMNKPVGVLEAEVLGWLRQRKKVEADRSGEAIKNRAQKPALYVEYLRILDAKANGITIAKIGEVLHPNENNDAPEYGRDKRLKAAAKAAEKLRDGGYRVLPSLEAVGWGGHLKSRKTKTP